MSSPPARCARPISASASSSGSGQEADGDRDRLAEGFVHTFKRDCVSVHELRDAESVLAQLGDWIEDYNIRER